MVLQHGRCHAARDARVVVDKRVARLSGIGSVEVGHVHVSPQPPVLRQVVGQLGVAAVLLKAHVGPVAVRPAVGGGCRAAEPSFAHLVGGFGLHGAIRACPEVDVCLHTVLLHLPGDDVYDSAHRVRAIEHGGRSPQHFYPFGQHGLVGVCDGVAEEAHVLRMSVDEHQHLCAARHAAHTDAACRPGGHAVAHDTA